MFNQGIRHVQDMLLENGNKEAVFDVSKLTAFEVTVPSTVDVTQDVTQGNTLDIWIEEQIRQNPKITTKDLAKQSGLTSRTIKRHIIGLTHIKYVGSGYSGHWEILKTIQGRN